MFAGLFAFVCVSLIRPALLTCIADFRFLKHPHPLWICVCLAGDEEMCWMGWRCACIGRKKTNCPGSILEGDGMDKRGGAGGSDG